MRALLVMLILAVPLAAFPVPKPAQTQSVAGTTWKGPIQWSNGYQLLEHTITFENGGKLVMTYKQFAGTKYDGTWKQDGNKLIWDITDKSWYEATITGTEMTGTAKNTTNMTATYSATREASK